MQGIICEQYVQIYEETGSIETAAKSISISSNLPLSDVQRIIRAYIGDGTPITMTFALESPIFKDYTITDYTRVIREGDSYNGRVKRVRDVGEDQNGLYFHLHGLGQRKYRPEDLELVRLGEYKTINHYE
jgi:hypothetical protein